MRWFWFDRFIEFEHGRRAVAIKAVTLAGLVATLLAVVLLAFCMPVSLLAADALHDWMVQALDNADPETTIGELRRQCREKLAADGTTAGYGQDLIHRPLMVPEPAKARIHLSPAEARLSRSRRCCSFSLIRISRPRSTGW